MTVHEGAALSSEAAIGGMPSRSGADDGVSGRSNQAGPAYGCAASCLSGGAGIEADAPRAKLPRVLRPRDALRELSARPSGVFAWM